MVLTFIMASALLATAVPAASAATGPEYWQGGKPVPNGSKIPYTWSGGQLSWESAAGETWECSSSAGTGEIVNSSEGLFRLTLKKCAWEHEGEISCASAFQPTGTIVLEPLKSDLRYGRNGAGTRVALNDLSTVSASTVTKFACGSALFEWTGSLLGSFESVGKETSANSLILKTGLHGYEQEHKEYETLTAECTKTGSTVANLSESKDREPLEQIGLHAPDTITFNEKVEIHTTC